MKRILLALLLAVAAASGADAAVIYLKDGTRLEGTIVSATARDVEIYTGQGTQRVDVDRILRIDYQGAAPGAPPPAAVPSPPVAQPVYPPAPPPQARYRRPRPAFEDRKQMLSIDFGVAAPLSDVDFGAAGGGTGSNGAAGPLIGFQYIYYLSPNLAAGGELEYFHRSATDSQSLLPSADTNVFGDDLALLGVLKWTLTSQGWARPFFLGGLGVHRATTLIDATPNPGFTWSDTSTDETRRLVDGSSWGPATALRFGVDFMADPSVFTMEIGWMGLYGVSAGATPAGQALGLSSVSGPLHVLTVAGRWGWRF